MAYTNQSTTASAREGIERAGDATANVANKAADVARNVGHDMSAAVGQAAEIAQDQIDSMTAYVRKNPLQATAIAAGVGFVFALLARR